MPTHRSFTLSPSHYAYQWDKQESTSTSPQFVTDLGRDYVLETDPVQKQAILFQIIGCFHFYLAKYVKLVLHGHIHFTKGKADADVVTLVRYFAPAGTHPTRKNLTPVARMLHLAFKQMSGEEIYNVMCTCIIKAINSYDPFYVDKVRTVVAHVSALPTDVVKFTAEQLGVPFDPSKVLRMCSKKDFLKVEEKITEGEKEVFSYSKVNWPPPKKFLNAEPIGLTYHIQKWFRFALQHYIHQTMSITEYKKDFMQLDHWKPDGGIVDRFTSNNNFCLSGCLPAITGEGINLKGRFVGADMSMVNKSFDLSEINLAWVKNTADPMFKNLSVDDRYLLYLIFARQSTWTAAAKTLGCQVPEVRNRFDTLIQSLKTIAGV